MKSLYSLLFLLCLCSSSLPLAAQSSGELDPTFSDDGTRIFDFGVGDERCAGLVIQPDQKIVIAGKSKQPDGNFRPTIIRMNPDGSTDDAFGENGIVVVDTTYSFWDGPSELLVRQNDGKLVMCFQISNVSQSTLAVVRLNADGSQDEDFGVNGIATNLVTGMNDLAHAVVVQEDGKIVVVGQGTTFSGDSYRMIATRFNADGTLDDSFADQGNFMLSQAVGDDIIMDVKQMADGKLLLLGHSYFPGGLDYIVLMRMNEDGSLDTSYGEGGIVNLQVTEDTNVGRAMALTADGKVVIGGVTVTDNNGLEQLLVCVTPDGLLDDSFGNGGVVITSLSTSNDVIDELIVASDGNIITTGYRGGNNDHGAVVCYTPTGALVDAFGDGGIAILTAYSYRVENIKQQADGKLVIVGSDFSLPTVTPDFRVDRMIYLDANLVSDAFADEDEVGIFPNPMHEHFTLDIPPSFFPAVVEIWNAEGKLMCVEKPMLSMSKMELDGLAPGVYTVAVHSHGRIIHKRIVVQ